MFINSINFLDDEDVMIKFRMGSLSGEILLNYSLIEGQELDEIEYQVYSAVMDELHSYCGLEFSNRRRQESFEALEV